MKPFEQLSRGQKRFLTTVVNEWCRLGCMPSFRELMIPLGYTSPNAIVTHLQPLKRYGWVWRSDGVNARNWGLTENALRYFQGCEAGDFAITLRRLVPEETLVASEAIQIACELLEAVASVQGVSEHAEDVRSLRAVATKLKHRDQQQKMRCG